MKESDIRPKHLQDEFLRLSKEDIKEFFSDDSSREHCPCPACAEKSKFKPQFVKNGFTYVECCQCGTLFVNPRPNEISINEYYKKSKAAQYWAEHLFKETEEGRRRTIFAPKAKMVVELLNATGSQRMGTLLDVGMGYGIFAEEIQKLNYFDKIVGAEPSPFLSEVCRKKGFEVIEQPVEMMQSHNHMFDVAVSFEVIEHLYSPKRFLEAICSQLKENGYIILTTLNIKGFELLNLWDNSDSIYPPHHINFFSLESLSKLLERVGCKVIKAFTPGKLDVDIVANKIDVVSGNRFIKYLVGESSETLRSNFQKFLQDNRLSSHMCVIAQYLSSSVS